MRRYTPNRRAARHQAPEAHAPAKSIESDFPIIAIPVSIVVTINQFHRCIGKPPPEIKSRRDPIQVLTVTFEPRRVCRRQLWVENITQRFSGPGNVLPLVLSIQMTLLRQRARFPALSQLSPDAAEREGMNRGPRKALLCICWKPIERRDPSDERGLRREAGDRAKPAPARRARSQHPLPAQSHSQSQVSRLARAGRRAGSLLRRTYSYQVDEVNLQHPAHRLGPEILHMRFHERNYFLCRRSSSAAAK